MKSTPFISTLGLWCLTAIAMAGMNLGCATHGSLEIVDAHGYHHQGYYDDHHDWHGGYYDEHNVYHDDAHDWHK